MGWWGQIKTNKSGDTVAAFTPNKETERTCAGSTVKRPSMHDASEHLHPWPCITHSSSSTQAAADRGEVRRSDRRVEWTRLRSNPNANPCPELQLELVAVAEEHRRGISACPLVADRE